MFLVEKDFDYWVRNRSPKLYGFVVQRVYGMDNVREIVHRTYEHILTHKGTFETEDKFTSYAVKCAQYEILNWFTEQAGFLKPSQAKAHKEKVYSFSRLTGNTDLSQEALIAVLDNKNLKHSFNPDESVTGVAKIEYEEFMKDKLKPKQFEIFKMRLYGHTYSEIAEAVGISETNVWGYIKRIKLIIEKL